MPPNRRAKKKRELKNRSLGLPVLPEPETVASLVEAIEKFLSQQQAMVGNDGYGAATKSVRAYTSRLEFYKEFCALNKIAGTETLKDPGHLWAYVAWLRHQCKYDGEGKERKRSGENFSDRYVHNIVSTLATFAVTLDIDTVSKKVLKKLGYTKKEIVAYSQQDLNLLWAATATMADRPYPPSCDGRGH